jgi:HK97 family phage portal protein
MLADRVAAARASKPTLVRSDPVSMEEFGYLLGAGRGNVIRTKAGASVGPMRALGLSAWYSGVRYLAETVASLPVGSYRDDAVGRSERAKPVWMARPDVELPWFQFVELTMMALLHKGNSYTFKMRNLAGQVIGLREIHPDRVTVGVAPDGTKRFLVDRIEREFTTREILHIPGLAYDGRVGMNPIQVLAEPLGGIAATDDYASRFFASGTHVGGIISFAEDMTQQEAQDRKHIWDTFHEGLLNAHKTGVLTGGAKYERISLDAQSTQLLESRQYGVSEVSRMLRIPPHKLYDLTRATFSNIEHQSIEAVVDSVRPWCTRIEAFINFDPDLQSPGNFVEFNLEGLLRGDTVARADFYKSGITAGWLTPASAARRENEPAPPEIDYYQRPLNTAVIREGQPELTNEEVPA